MGATKDKPEVATEDRYNTTGVTKGTAPNSFQPGITFDFVRQKTPPQNNSNKEDF